MLIIGLGDFDMQVDTVEQRIAYFGSVMLDFEWTAGARMSVRFGSEIPTRARVHSGRQYELRGK
ncbi:hypothetical protein D3C78_1924130 [compost metagenome]